MAGEREGILECREGSTEEMSESDAGADRAISLREAARILDVCVRTVRREIERRRLVGFRVGRSLRIRMSDLRRYMERKLVHL